jgi:hypothetical protein
MAFVVPAEIGHARYAAPLLSFLARSFGRLHLIAVRETVFAQLSQDVWFLYAEDFGCTTDYIALTTWDRFKPALKPPKGNHRVSFREWESFGYRLRPFVLPDEARQLYARLSESNETYRLGETARVGIGYVSGANEFFHLRPSEAKLARIPKNLLFPTVRSGRVLPKHAVTGATVSKWLKQDEACLLLRIQPSAPLPETVLQYLDSAAGRQARNSYKCSHRKPWYVVPDVIIPDGFLSYMSGEGPSLVSNSAGCACTNSIHAVRMKCGHAFSELQAAWDHPLTRLSTELEGHPLGGGMLKLEPKEAARVALPRPSLRLSTRDLQQLHDARAILRRWRHYE